MKDEDARIRQVAMLSLMKVFSDILPVWFSSDLIVMIMIMIMRIEETGIENIRAHESEILEYMLEQFKDIPEIQVLGNRSEEYTSELQSLG